MENLILPNPYFKSIKMDWIPWKWMHFYSITLLAKSDKSKFRQASATNFFNKKATNPTTKSMFAKWQQICNKTCCCYIMPANLARFLAPICSHFPSSKFCKQNTSLMMTQMASVLMQSLDWICCQFASILLSFCLESW